MINIGFFLSVATTINTNIICYVDYPIQSIQTHAVTADILLAWKQYQKATDCNNSDYLAPGKLLAGKSLYPIQ